MMRKILFCLIITVLLISAVSAYTLDDIEWSDDAVKSGTLKWGETFKTGDYTIKAEDFNEEGFVSIGIYRNGQLQKKSPARAGEGFEFRDTEKGDDLRIYVKKVTLNIDEWTGNMDDPSAEIEVYERGIPEMKIDIETEDDTYDPRTVKYQSIITTIDIENEGDAEAEVLDVEIDANGMELLDGDLSHHFTSVEEDEVLSTLDLKFEIPHYWEETDVDIKVTTRSEDINGEIHEDTKTETITIEPVAELVVSKTVTEEIYIDETAHVSVSIWNNGIYNLGSVSVSNPTTDDLEVQDNVDNEITLSFGPKETKAKIYEYTLKPTKTGTYKIPVATAIFTDPDGKKHTFRSESKSIEIDGPDIVLSKQVSPEQINPGGKATVKVTVKNRGTKDASVTTSETIPDYATYINGDLSFHDVATHGKSYSYSYVIQIDEIGEFKLPETTSTFIDFEDYKGERISNTPLITVVDPSAETESSSSSSDSSAESGSSGNNGQQSSSVNEEYYESNVDDGKVQPGFEASLMILVMFAVYFVSKRRDRS